MATRQLIESPSRKLKSALSSEVQIYVGGVPFTLDRELLAAKSAKLAVLLKEHPREDLSHFLKDASTDPETFELVARFCHGYEINLSTENVIHVACLAHYLGMTDSHSTNNLLSKAVDFFEHQIIPSWSKSIRALKAAEKILQQAVDLGLVGACVESVITKALEHPQLLGEPMKNLTCNDDGEDSETAIRPNVRRKLFAIDWKSEDLTMLSLRLYEPIISAMIQRNVPAEYVSAAVCQYAKKWVLSGMKEGDDGPIYKTNIQREIIEAVERMLPNKRGLQPCSLLFDMLRSAIALDASTDCRNGFEVRIGKELDQATVKDLLIPSQGYSKEEQYDTECVRRILKNFYRNYTGRDGHKLVIVAELIDNFLIEIASDRDLKMGTFISIAELSIAVSEGIQKSSDGIYRAIDIYFDTHRYLTESEREEICNLLDCNKMSPEACEHAAQNERLPLRVVVQVLFVVQLQMRETMPKEVQGSDNRLLLLKDVEEEEAATRASNNEEEARAEIEKMGSKVLELERECLMMRREIQNGSCRKVKHGKGNMWKEMKRKFGCITSINDCNCHAKKKKVHPR
ncbi:hypothetical protein ACH5RR_036122 [Cinchona calisaya]|uniref:Phototropic-responsive NPH3 family protein n=1 Tax=Cinchona calisaya TaxID=153742 RepID=A0ABD2Y2G2_9GENT